jgi:hypothetical protein
MHQKLILRRRDGSMTRCTTYSHFSAAFQSIKVINTDGKVDSVPLSELKAIFFVKDFGGNPHYHAHGDFSDESPKAGKAVKVTFHDGEIMRGRVINMSEGHSGFFIFPADPLDNNEKVFIVRSPDLKVEVEG